jgi:hypothetical protein
LDNAIIQKIQFEIEQIEELIKASSPVFQLCRIREPDFVEKCGIALILQSFYNGIEKIMLLIIKNKDMNLLKITANCYAGTGSRRAKNLSSQ